MCWSGEASAALAVVGLVTTGYAAWTGESPRLYMALAYFSMMELLQAYTYSVIGQCGLPANQIATVLSYLHIAFQPFFINLMSMYFIPDRIRQKIEYPVYALCFASAVFMILQLYPFEWAGQCVITEQLCARDLCSVHGNWHIAWNLPINGLTNFLVGDVWTDFLTQYPTYIITGLILPFLYGSWRFTLYHFLIGPQLALLLTDDPNEVAAIWCLLSIGILILVIKTPIRKYMHVKKWLLWPETIRALIKRQA